MQENRSNAPVPILTADEYRDLRRFMRMTIRWLYAADPTDGDTIPDALYRDELPVPVYWCNVCGNAMWSMFPGMSPACPECGHGHEQLAEAAPRFVSKTKAAAYGDLPLFNALCRESKGRIAEVRQTIVDMMIRDGFSPVIDPVLDDEE